MVTIRYKNCTPELTVLLQRFEPEIQRASETHGLSDDVVWELYYMTTEIRSFPFLRLYVPARPDAEMGGDYGAEFVTTRTAEEFYWWITRKLPFYS